jgi:DNA repair exonuclease SbcCD ATPase subunit
MERAVMIELKDILLPAGMLLITMWLMFRLRRKRAQVDNRPTAHEQLEQNRQARGMRGDLEQVMVEVEQLARRFGAQLDAKSTQLNQLIEQADRRIAELKRLEDRAAPAAPPPTQVADELREPLEPESESDLAQSVYRLADAGNDAIEIARSLNEHVGKIELILALRER